MKKKIIMVSMLFIIVLVGCVWYFNNANSDGDANAKATISEGYPGGISQAEMQEAMQREADKNYWSFDVNAEPVFKNGSAEGFLRIVNPPYNTYPIEVDIRLIDTKELLFQSGRLKPNQYIGYGKLNKKLPKGSYPAEVEIRAYENDGEKMFNKAYAEITIKVEN